MNRGKVFAKMTLKTVVVINDKIQLFYNLLAVTSLSSSGLDVRARYLENMHDVVL